MPGGQLLDFMGIPGGPTDKVHDEHARIRHGQIPEGMDTAERLGSGHEGDVTVRTYYASVGE